jgi:hypothetical protein
MRSTRVALIPAMPGALAPPPLSAPSVEAAPTNATTVDAPCPERQAPGRG